LRPRREDLHSGSEKSVETARSAGYGEPGHSAGEAVLVASTMLDCDRPRFGLALRIRVVCWNEPLLRACPRQNSADCAGVCGCCSPCSLRHARGKVARCLTTFLFAFWLRVHLLERRLGRPPQVRRTSLRITYAPRGLSLSRPERSRLVTSATVNSSPSPAIGSTRINLQSLQKTAMLTRILS
jgi:hypothetical protein